MNNDTTPKRHLVLIDGYGFVFRAYHSMPPLTRPSDGTPVGAVYGFTNMLIKLKSRMHQGERYYMAVILDSGSKTFRNDLYPAYKANRPPAPEDLIPQFPLVREAALALGFPTLEMKGYEADDLIATYARLASEQDMDVTIVSSDKDLMQLVRPGVAMYDAMKDRIIGDKEVFEKFGVTPDKVLDVLALMGDSSDNIPGVPGIGPKTAAELVLHYGSLEATLERAAEIKQNKRRETILANIEQAKISKKLASLCDTAPLPAPLDDLMIDGADAEKLRQFLLAQGFKSLASRLEQKEPPPHAPRTENTPHPSAPVAKKESISTPEKAPEQFQLITDISVLKEWLSGAREMLALHPLFEGNKLLGISLARKAGDACHIPLTLETPARQGTLDLLQEANDNQANFITLETFLSEIKSLLQQPYILKIAHDMKACIRTLNITHLPAPIDDTMLLSYVLDGTQNNHELSALAEQHLDVTLGIPAEILPPKTALSSLDPARYYTYCCKNAGAILSLHQLLRQRLFDEHMVTVYETIERPLVLVLTKMEQAGVKLDTTMLRELSADFSHRITAFEKEIFALANEEFNIGSPKQLGEVLFEHLGIQGGKKSGKSAAYTVGADILEELQLQGHTIAGKVLEWRALSKLKSTYTDALAEHIDPKTGRVHSTFTMTVTNTGRLSSINPNLQNIPIRSEEGRKIRRAFIAEKGYKLISADYSQIELRLLASLADIGPLKKAFAEGKDIHALTASQVFGIPLEQITSEHRSRAKAINFGIIYGQSAFGLAASLGIGRDEAKKYIEAYFQQYPGIRAYMEKTKELAHKQGYVTTLFGRKCFLPGINGKGPMRAFAERAAINAPLQGTAADIIKRAMIALDKALPPEARLILQIHDELLVEVKAAHAESVAATMKKIMDRAAALPDVPLITAAAIGDNWGEVH